jgi:hypothetical protein
MKLEADALMKSLYIFIVPNLRLSDGFTDEVKFASILCHVECWTLEKGALRYYATPPVTVCHSTLRNIPGDLNRR